MYPAKALGEPFVNIEGETVVRQGSDGAMIEWDRVIFEAVEIVGVQHHEGRPKNALPVVFGIPQLKTADDSTLRLDVGFSGGFSEAEQAERGR